MLSPYAVLAFFALLFLMVRYDSIATAYDNEQRSLDWDYCSCSGSFRDVITWWWRR